MIAVDRPQPVATAFTKLGSHGHAGGALEFAPTDPGPFDGTQDCFPDAVTEHRTVDQAHRQNAPGAHEWFALEHAG